MSERVNTPGRLWCRRMQRRLAELRREQEGATVVEFAILAIPFFLLLFAILELALVFYISSAVDNAVADASRSVRVGQLQSQETTADAQLTKFRSDLCSGLAAFPSCQSRVRVIMKRSASGSFNQALTSSSDNELDCSGPREVVVLRVSYKMKLILPGKWTQLANAPDGTNAHMITSTTAFRNEPFPTTAGASCGTATSDNSSGTTTTPATTPTTTT